MISPVFVLLGVLPALVSAANDWSVPCFQGVCAYDIKQDENDMPATMVIVVGLFPNTLLELLTGVPTGSPDPNPPSQMSQPPPVGRLLNATLPLPHKIFESFALATSKLPDVTISTMKVLQGRSFVSRTV